MKFKLDEVDLNSLRELKQKLAINVKRVRELVIIDINIGTEENIFVHADDEAEDIAQDLLPVFDEIRRGDYSFIWLAKALGSAHMGDDITALDALKKSRLPKHYTHVIELFECGDIIY